MPVYTLACRRPLDQETRDRVAETVTKTHCDVTGAPPEFVTVVFMDGHPIQGGKQIGLIGNVRNGGNRDVTLMKRLQDSIHENVAGSAGIPLEQLSVRLIGIPASWVMEGGEIMPEPGAEQEWRQQRHVRPGVDHGVEETISE